MLFLLALVVDGALAGAIYALIALGFVVVYKASRVINFALGEWLMVGALLVAVGAYRLALGLPGALLAACVGMIGFAVLFNRLVLRRLVGRPVVSLIMVTLGLGALMRGGAALLFRGIPAGVSLPLPQRVLEAGGLFVSVDKLVAGVVAATAVAAVTAAFHWTRTGVALRAIADDDRAALAAGIDVQRHLVIAWGTLGVLLSHAHGDHIGDTKPPGPDAGTCERPATVSAAPHSNTAEIAAGKNAAVVVSNDMSAFLGKKIQDIRGEATPPCPTAGRLRETTVPRPSPCVANLQLGGKRVLTMVGAVSGVQIALVRADHSNNVPRSLLSEPARTHLAADGLSAYVGHANGYVLVFTNGLRAYLSGDTAIMDDMRTIIGGFYRATLAVMNMGAFAMQSEEAAYAVNELLQARAVIPSHVNEAATNGGTVNAASKTKQFIDLVKGGNLHLPLSGKTMEFDGQAKCVSGC